MSQLVRLSQGLLGPNPSYRAKSQTPPALCISPPPPPLSLSLSLSLTLSLALFLSLTHTPRFSLYLSFYFPHSLPTFISLSLIAFYQLLTQYTLYILIRYFAAHPYKHAHTMSISVPPAQTHTHTHTYTHTHVHTHTHTHTTFHHTRTQDTRLSSCRSEEM